MKKDTKRKYLNQKSSAKARGIEWKITFEEWLEVWGDKLTFRGKKSSNYCMARFGDTGPYSKDNVKIITNRENISEREWSEEQRNKVRETTIKQFSDPTQREKTSNSMKALWEDPKYREHMSKVHLGQRWSEESRMKLSKALRGRKQSPEHISAVQVAKKANRELRLLIR